MRPRRASLRIAMLVACSTPLATMALDPVASQSESQRYIEESEAAWASSVATNDASVVKRILADDVVWVLDGKVIGKAQAVTAAANGPWTDTWVRRNGQWQIVAAEDVSVPL